jgi:DNA-binding MarR family transcriptional regulator
MSEDRRRVEVRATAEGRQVMDDGRRRRIEVLAEVLAGASTEELTEISRALTTVRRALEATR